MAQTKQGPESCVVAGGVNAMADGLELRRLWRAGHPKGHGTVIHQACDPNGEFIFQVGAQFEHDRRRTMMIEGVIDVDGGLL